MVSKGDDLWRGFGLALSPNGFCAAEP